MQYRPSFYNLDRGNKPRALGMSVSDILYYTTESWHCGPLSVQI